MRKFILLFLTLSLIFAACTRSQSAPNIPALPNATLPATLPAGSPIPSITPAPTATPTPLPEVRLESAESALFNGQWDAALQEFQAAFENTADLQIQSAALFGMARAQYLLKDYPNAIINLKTLLTVNPDAPQKAGAYFYLARAHQALEEYASAAQAYRDYLAAQPQPLGDLAQTWLGDTLLAMDDAAGAYQAYSDALGALQDISDFIPDQDIQSLKIKLANAANLAGDSQTALAIYQDVYQQTQNDYLKAQTDLLRGRILIESGQTDQAYQFYLDAVENYPLSYDSYSALVALVNAGIPVNDFDRGLVDYFAGQNGLAIEAFDRFLNAAPPDHPATAHYYKAMALRAMGEYQAAVDEWDYLIQTHDASDRFWDRAWEQKAYTMWAYLAQYQPAIDALVAFVEQNPAHPRAAEFLYDAARISEIGGALKQAVRLWNQVADDFPASDWAYRSRFLAGITQYRRGDFSAALQAFQSAEKLAVALEDLAAARLWQGKVHQKLNDPQAAQTVWQLAVSTDPTGYYSERARDLLLGRAPFSASDSFALQMDSESQRAVAETWMLQTFNLPPETDFNSLGALAQHPLYLRGMALWNLGLYDQASTEFEALRKLVGNDPLDSYRLAKAFAQIGLYRSAIFAARHVLDLAGMDDATTLTAPPYFTALRFGTYYQELVIPAAAEYQFHPLFLFSVIRQESLFESFIKSSAGARGLMQIIPSTGAAIAEQLNWPPNYSADDLYRPQVSIRFGADYLAEQRDFFDGDLFAALAAYNAGPGNANDWKQLAPDDPDLFLEVIRYRQPRDYIRRIYELFSIYRGVYQKQP